MFMYWSPRDGATQIPISEFEASRWHNSRVLYFTTQEFVSGTFRSVNSKAAYWPNTGSREKI